MWLYLRKGTGVTGCGSENEGYLHFVSKPFVCIFSPFICNIHFNINRGSLSDGIKNFFVYLCMISLNSRIKA